MTTLAAPLLTVKEVAHLLRQSPYTIYKKCHRGDIPAIRIGEGRAGIRIPRDELLKALYRTDEKERND